MRYHNCLTMFGRTARLLLFAAVGLSWPGWPETARACALEQTAALADATPRAVPEPIPRDQTPAAQLSTRSYQHQEVLRIRRDFGKAHFIIALDAWFPRASPNILTEVRLWWIDQRYADRRGPFSKRTTSHFDIEYTRNNPTSWDVLLLSDSKKFRFRVELADDGRVRAYATVVGPDGERIQRCHASSAELAAKRFLGIPTGIDSLVVSCIDPSGKRLVAPVVTDGSF